MSAPPTSCHTNEPHESHLVEPVRPMRMQINFYNRLPEL